MIIRFIDQAGSIKRSQNNKRFVTMLVLLTTQWSANLRLRDACLPHWGYFWQGLLWMA